MNNLTTDDGTVHDDALLPHEVRGLNLLAELGDRLLGDGIAPVTEAAREAAPRHPRRDDVA